MGFFKNKEEMFNHRADRFNREGDRYSEKGNVEKANWAYQQEKENREKANKFKVKKDW